MTVQRQRLLCSHHHFGTALLSRPIAYLLSPTSGKHAWYCHRRQQETLRQFRRNQGGRTSCRFQFLYHLTRALNLTLLRSSPISVSTKVRSKTTTMSCEYCEHCGGRHILHYRATIPCPCRGDFHYRRGRRTARHNVAAAAAAAHGPASAALTALTAPRASALNYSH